MWWWTNLAGLSLLRLMQPLVQMRAPQQDLLGADWRLLFVAPDALVAWPCFTPRSTSSGFSERTGPQQPERYQDRDPGSLNPFEPGQQLRLA